MTKKLDNKLDPKAKGKKTAKPDFDHNAMGSGAACPPSSRIRDANRKTSAMAPFCGDL
jgi:hypothetical protein